MRELSVGTHTTPVELAMLFNKLSPDDEVGGKPGPDGAVVLHVCRQGRSQQQLARSRAAISARVAIEVVLQHVEGMPGAQPLVTDIRERLAGDPGARAGWLAPPLTALARLYCRTAGAMSGSPLPLRMLPSDDGAEAAEQAQVTAEQRQVLESLIDRLMQLPSRSGELDGDRFENRAGDGRAT